MLFSQIVVRSCILNGCYCLLKCLYIVLIKISCPVSRCIWLKVNGMQCIETLLYRHVIARELTMRQDASPDVTTESGTRPQAKESQRIVNKDTNQVFLESYSHQPRHARIKIYVTLLSKCPSSTNS